MATDFFERQSSARRSTVWLALMFCLAVVGIVATVFAITAVAVAQQGAIRDPMNAGDFSWELPLLAAAATLLVIAGGTLYKVIELRTGGGTGVAERLGGQRIYPDTQDPTHRRLLNVVEEMAIASGTPVPPVFFLKDDFLGAANGVLVRDPTLVTQPERRERLYRWAMRIAEIARTSLPSRAAARTRRG